MAELRSDGCVWVSPADSPAKQAYRAAKEASPLIEWLARIGFAAKGVVYGLVGTFTILSTIGLYRDTKGSAGVLRSIADASYGPVVLAALGIGLAGYALWCLVKAIFDAEGDGWVYRVASAFEGLFYLSLVAAVVCLMTGFRASVTDDQGAEGWTAWLLAWPGGKWAAVGTGLLVSGYGCYALFGACRPGLDCRLNLSDLTPRAARWLARISRFGMASWGVVFLLLGLFLIAAGWHSNPAEAKSVPDALNAIKSRPYGPALTGTIGVGMICYSVYDFALARYRHIKPV